LPYSLPLLGSLKGVNMVHVAKGRDARKRRQEAAKERQDNYRTPKAQMSHLDREGYHAKKERKKLNVKK
jgi:hypothetical protein